MGQVAQGQTWTWVVTLYDGSHALADSSDLALTIYDPTGAASLTPAGPFIPDSLGVYHYDWAVPANAMVGDWTAGWSGTLDISHALILDVESVTVVGAYCTPDDVKERMAGTTWPGGADEYDRAIADHIAEVSSEIDQEVRAMRAGMQGWTFLPSAPVTRRYTGYPGGSSLLLIDDALAIASVTLLKRQGQIDRTLALGADYLPCPLNGLPITGLERLCDVWPTWVGGVQVELTPGFCLVVPWEVKDVATTEVVRALTSARSGENDQVGIGPLGTVVTSKALTNKSIRILGRYTRRAGWFRT